MHSPQALTLLALGLATGTNAAFWLAKASLSTAIPGPVDPSNGNWQFVFTPDINNCGANSDASLYNKRSDVSGDKKGVRIEFEDQGDDLLTKLKPTVAEWNTWRDIHQTWYRDCCGDVVDLVGNYMGHCDVDMSVNIDCSLPALGSGNFQSVLRCDFDIPSD